MFAQDNIATKGWFETIKEKFSIQDWFARLNLSSQRLIEIFAYTGIGFLIGFLIKRYAKYVIFYIVILTLVLWSLYYLKVITIDWDGVKSLFSVHDKATFENISSRYFDWAKNHIFEVVGALIGLILGFKIG